AEGLLPPVRLPQQRRRAGTGRDRARRRPEAPGDYGPARKAGGGPAAATAAGQGQEGNVRVALRRLAALRVREGDQLEDGAADEGDRQFALTDGPRRPQRPRLGRPGQERNL